MRRTDLMDTAGWAHRKIIDRLRGMTPAERLQMALEATDVQLIIHREAEIRVGKKIPFHKP